MKKVFVSIASLLLLQSCSPYKTLERDNPVRPLPKIPLGISGRFEDLKSPPTADTVRLGRWLFFDKRLSKDGTVSCANCHQPDHAFSETTPVSIGINGQKGSRKAPSFVNQAWTLYPNFFWDGRAQSLEEQASGPMANPVEMGHTHEAIVSHLQTIKGYRYYFEHAFGTDEINLDRITKAIADYERTRLSGNSPYDRWINGDKQALNKKAQTGMDLFFDKAECNQCHLGQNFTDSLFHNLGIGWNEKEKKFKDEGRSAVTKLKVDRGAFKTPGLRDVSKRAPYMHDGSIQTLEEVVEHYNKGGTPNPNLSPKIRKLNLTKDEVLAVVEFMKSLDGEGYQDESPKYFPQ